MKYHTLLNGFQSCRECGWPSSTVMINVLQTLAHLFKLKALIILINTNNKQDNIKIKGEQHYSKTTAYNRRDPRILGNTNCAVLLEKQ